MGHTGRRILITGGAGHIGSHLAAALADEAEVIVLDDLSSGSSDRVPTGVSFHEVDVSDVAASATYYEDVDLVYHLAVAEKDVAAGAREQFRANVDVTFGVLDAAMEAGVERLIFTSSSTVYGEQAPRPTPESYGPLAPISPYGAAKVAEEAILSTAVERAGMSVSIARLANVVGPVFDGSVTPDFVEKLTADPTELEILGDGRQEKSFIHASDVATALQTIAEAAPDGFEVYNVGTTSALSVRELATIVADILGVDPAYSYTGGDRGWTGDVPRMCLDVSRLEALGWQPINDCEGAIRLAAEQLGEQVELPE